MRLLFVTQAVDERDPVLGFVCGWIRALTEQCSHVSVVCLRAGAFSLPDTVSVSSLGKERGGGNKLLYAARFLAYVWRTRDAYDAVFVHMNQEYVLLGGLLWRLWGRRVGFWYNHTAGGVWTRVAMRIANVVFHTSPYAFTAGTKKSVRMPAGIDTNLFSPVRNVPHQPRSALYLGRIAPVKGVKTLVGAALILYKRRINFSLTVCGDALPRDVRYEQEVRVLAEPLVAAGMCCFLPAVPNKETPPIFSTHDIFVNLTPRGNYDKTVLEAVLCGAIPVVSSPAFRDALPPTLFFAERDAASLADALERVWGLSSDVRRETAERLRSYMAETHDLTVLVKKIYAHLLPR